MSPQKPLIWMAALVAGITAFLTAGYLLLRPDALPPAASTNIEQDVSMKITIPPHTQPQLYRFRARPDRVTQLQLDTDNPDFAFVAEVSDSKGEPIATLNGSRLNRAALTIEPGNEEYRLSLAPLEGSEEGTVSLTLGEPPAPLPTPEPESIVCGVISGLAEGTPVRSGPRPEYSMVGALLPQDMLMAQGRIRGGWYLVEMDAGFGWVAGESVQLYGDCHRLPVVLDPAIPAAPADEEPYVLNVDRDGDGYLTEAIAYPYEDTADLAWLNVLNLYDRAPSNYREFTLTLSCEGVGAEAVRWGAPEQPVHRCGESILMPVMHGMSQQPFLILLPRDSEQSYVRYTLLASSSGLSAED